MNFHLTHVTLEFHRVYLTIFGPIACLAQTVHLSCIEISTISKETEASFHLTTSSRRSIKCSQKDFCAHGTFGANCAPIAKRTESSFHLAHITKEVHRVQPKRFLCPWYIRCKPCTYLMPRLTPPPSRLK
jgi:hypothetical protein